MEYLRDQGWNGMEWNGMRGSSGATARDRRPRTAQTGVLLRRGVHLFVQRGTQGARRAHRAGGTPGALQGRGGLFRHAEPTGHSDSVLGPSWATACSTRCRAFTPRDQKAVKATATTMWAQGGPEHRAAITELAVGEALVSFLDPRGAAPARPSASTCCRQAARSAPSGRSAARCSPARSSLAPMTKHRPRVGLTRSSNRADAAANNTATPRATRRRRAIGGLMGGSTTCCLAAPAARRQTRPGADHGQIRCTMGTSLAVRYCAACSGILASAAETLNQNGLVQRLMKKRQQHIYIATGACIKPVCGHMTDGFSPPGRRGHVLHVVVVSGPPGRRAPFPRLGAGRPCWTGSWPCSRASGDSIQISWCQTGQPLVPPRQGGRSVRNRVRWAPPRPVLNPGAGRQNGGHLGIGADCSLWPHHAHMVEVPGHGAMRPCESRASRARCGSRLSVRHSTITGTWCGKPS